MAVFSYGKHDRNKRRHYTYEKLISVGNDPFIFEVRGSTGVYNLLKPEVYKPKLEPIIDFYGRSVGHVLVIPLDSFRHIQNSEQVSDFLKEGRKIVPLYSNRSQFYQDVLNFIEKAGLRLKDQKTKVV